MSKPVLFLMDDELPSLERVRDELERRYGVDYEIVTESSARASLARLTELRDAQREVVIVFADYNTVEMPGLEMLAHVHELLPETKRALLVDLGDISCAGTLLEVLTFGQADTYITKPFHVPDEAFHRAIGELLDEWAQAHRPPFHFVRVVGEQWSPRSHALRDMLQRGGIPGIFYDVNSTEGRDLLKAVELTASTLPVCVLYNADVLIDPSDEELDEAIGVNTHPQDTLYDLAIVGAGPAGLSAAVYAASEGLKTVSVEREAPGGQAGSSSLVRNYLGFPRGIGGADLMHRAFRQAWLFQAQFVFSREAVDLRSDDAEGRTSSSEQVVMLSNGERIRSRAVLLAMGITYRRLGIPSLDRLMGAGVFYSTAVSEAQAMRGKDVYVVGAGNSAGQAAIHLAKYARRVTMLVRGDSLGESMSDYLVQEIQSSLGIRVRLHTSIVDAMGERLLEGLVLRNHISGKTEQVEAAAVFVLVGGVPHTDWLPPTVRRDSQGYILTGADLLDEEARVDGRVPLPLETSMPGVFAAGDARHGAAKRIASAVGEGAIAIQYVHEYLAGLVKEVSAYQPQR
ncbi:MAG: NAD(P)/FAD-dependent oxidoreductase [Anaerolineae bacterium]